MLKNLINLIYPEICSGCNQLLLKNEKTICTNCISNLPITYHFKITENEITQKLYGIVPIEFAASFLYFRSEGITQSLIHNLKYQGKQEIGAFLGNLFVNDLATVIAKHNVDEIIPVPLHSKRLKERGFNQVSTFCDALSNGLNIPVNESLLIRNTYTSTQTFKNKEDRRFKNNLFETKYTENDYGKHFLLVDDVITTGATLEKCIKALLLIPNSKVSIVTIAFTQS